MWFGKVDAMSAGAESRLHAANLAFNSLLHYWTTSLALPLDCRMLHLHGLGVTTPTGLQGL